MLPFADRGKAIAFFESPRGLVAAGVTKGRILGEVSPGRPPNKQMREGADLLVRAAIATYTGKRAEYMTSPNGHVLHQLAQRLLGEELQALDK